MPVDLALSTNTPTATIELRQAQPLGNGDHLAAFLLVRSGAFAAALPFVFRREELLSFSEAIEALCVSRSGAARLRGSENDDVIRFESGNDGAIRVCGELHEATGNQRLDFSFVAEWEGLGSFVEALQELQRSRST